MVSQFGAPGEGRACAWRLTFHKHGRHPVEKVARGRDEVTNDGAALHTGTAATRQLNLRFIPRCAQ